MYKRKKMKHEIFKLLKDYAQCFKSTFKMYSNVSWIPQNHNNQKAKINLKGA